MKQRSMLYPAVEYEQVRQIIEASIKEHADRNAFIIKHKVGKQSEYESISYRQFGDDIRSLGTALLHRHCEGKRIAIIGKNSYAWITGYFAGLGSNMIVVPLDRGLPGEEIESCLARSKADILLFDVDHKEQVQALMRKSRSDMLFVSMETCDNFLTFSDLIGEGEELLRGGDTSYDTIIIRPDDMSFILFTSGTTQASKAVMLSQRNIASNIYALTRCEAIFPTDVNMAFLPFHHTFSSTGIVFILSKGATNVFCDGLKYIAQNLKEYKVSVFICVPLIIEAMYKKIFQEAKKQNKEALLRRMLAISSVLLKIGIDVRRKLFRSVIEQLGGHIRFVISGAAAISPEVAMGFNALGILTVQGYGLTETSPVLSAENAENIRCGSVGVPMCNVEIAIDHPDEQSIGEVIAKGPNVMLGYYEDVQETERVLIDGWFHTGDLGYVDCDGFLYLCGRKKNVIVQKSGKNIYPEEIELLLNRLPYLSESMVFGWEKGDDYIVSAKLVYDEELVREMVPECIKNSKIDESLLRARIEGDIEQINRSLPAYKHIRRFILSDIPTVKTTTAKIKRHEEMQTITSDEV